LNIRKRMILILMAAAIPGMTVAFYLAYTAMQNERESRAQTAAWLAKLQAASYSNVIANARAVLDTTSHIAMSREPAAAGDALDCATQLAVAPKLSGSFKSLTFYAPSGETVCTTSDEDLDSTASDSPWFQRVLDERSFTLSGYRTSEGGNPLIVAASPLIDVNDRIRGVLALGIDLDWLNFLTANIELPEGAEVTAIGPNGNPLMRRENNVDGKVDDYLEKMRNLMVENISGALTGRNDDDQDRVYGYAITEVGQLLVVVDLPTFVPYDRAAEALFNTLAAPIAILLLVLLATGWASETFVVRWVRSLTTTANKLAEGKLSVRTSVPYSQGEIGQLAEMFDEMAEAIEQKQFDTESLVVQREGLLRELNHRTANNMAVLAGLVELERRRHRGGAATAEDSLTNLGGRIRTLANVHRLLYERVAEATPLERREAIERLVDLLAEFYLPPETEISLQRDIEAFELDIDQSVTLTMLLNELLCNAYKHAFRPGERGTVQVACRRIAAGNEARIELSVEDNGHGFADDTDPEDALGIVRALVEQVDGDITVESVDPGTRVRVSFALVSKREPQAA
jgi:two-component sensor histidine kinase